VKVREVIRLSESDGWQEVRSRGSHRQFKHAVKTGTVTVSGKLGLNMPRGTALDREAIEMHLESMREDGLTPPKPSSSSEYVEVGVA
jgi:predicted RNA binding protein YcfA (HicA-like mRNA interferase family)